MASVIQSDPEIPDNFKESWLVLLSAAEAYCQKSGCDLAIITANKRFRPSVPDGDSGRGWDGSRKWEYSYHAWGQGMLADATRRYMDDIAVLHSASVLTAQRQARSGVGEASGAHLGADVPCEPGGRVVSNMCLFLCLFMLFLLLPSDSIIAAWLDVCLCSTGPSFPRCLLVLEPDG